MYIYKYEMIEPKQTEIIRGEAQRGGQFAVKWVWEKRRNNREMNGKRINLLFIIYD
jgi:hypothetical protein